MILQIKPNHADHISSYTDKYLNSMFESETIVAQRKYDGERMLIHFDNGKTYCTSRRIGKNGLFTQNEDKIINLPTLQNIGYTVIDCECYAANWSEIVGVLHSLPERAHTLQKNGVKVKFAVFDCLFFDDTDIRDAAYLERLYRAIDVVEALNMNNMSVVESTQVISKENAMEFMQVALSEGFEGCVIKSLERAYYDKGASLKCKKFETVDCVVCGYQNGNGKYANTIGALEIGYYDEKNDKFIPISKVNCGTDAERELWNIHRKEWLHSVIEVKCQEITNKSLRHPVYIRRRDDKDYKMCTKDTIFK